MQDILDTLQSVVKGPRESYIGHHDEVELVIGVEF
jgi:hypothetical protein